MKHSTNNTVSTLFVLTCLTCSLALVAAGCDSGQKFTSQDNGSHVDAGDSNAPALPDTPADRARPEPGYEYAKASSADGKWHVKTVVNDVKETGTLDSMVLEGPNDFRRIINESKEAYDKYGEALALGFTPDSRRLVFCADYHAFSQKNPEASQNIGAIYSLDLSKPEGEIIQITNKNANLDEILAMPYEERGKFITGCPISLELLWSNEKLEFDNKANHYTINLQTGKVDVK